MQWEIADNLIEYEDALTRMQQRARDIRDGAADELVWLVEHPPIYTGGTSAKENDIVDPDRFPIYETGRGGQYTYHGPGQRVCYVMLDLKKHSCPPPNLPPLMGGGSESQRDSLDESKPDIRLFVKQLEQWLINTLARFDVIGEIREGRVGVWVKVGNTEKKIAALGIRLHKWVSFHGVALNVHPDLSHYDGIVPCGISDYGVTSLKDLGVNVSMAQVDAVLREEFEKALQ